MKRSGTVRGISRTVLSGANGQGKPKDEAQNSLAEAIALILVDRREDGLRGVPPETFRETVGHVKREGCSYTLVETQWRPFLGIVRFQTAWPARFVVT